MYTYLARIYLPKLDAEGSSHRYDGYEDNVRLFFTAPLTLGEILYLTHGTHGFRVEALRRFADDTKGKYFKGMIVELLYVEKTDRKALDRVATDLEKWLPGVRHRLR